MTEPNDNAFFQPERSQFFRPLTSKYREMAVECLKLLYLRFYTSMADYGHALRKEQMLELFQTALARAPELDFENESGLFAEDSEFSPNFDDGSQAKSRFRSDRDKALWILNNLVENGWLEVQVDEVSLQARYHFTRAGRLFTQPFVELSGSSLRTRHRNTRNTRNALRAFVDEGEVHDLLDAYEYSERIISDFTDIITELEERKRQLVREIEVTALIQKASDEFFDFMDKRFQPDLSVRLSADSVEKHRDEITGLIQDIRALPKTTKAEAEGKLRQLLPGQVKPGQSLLWSLLDGIETRLANACEIMLPALRGALRNFTRRADIIIRQMSYLASQRHNDMVQVCQDLSSAAPEEQNRRLQLAGDMMANLQVGLIDPRQIVIREGRRKLEVDTRVAEMEELDQGARKSLFIQNALDQAFVIHDDNTRAYMLRALSGGQRLHSKHLKIEAAPDLLAVTHAIELASVNGNSSDYEFIIEPTGHTLSNDYLHQADDFIIEVRSKTPENLSGENQTP
ncbi:Wadjet anti-phage system protein JetA family protein [Hahella ganghwensis]|uniref:Wadjet anti-phage system protein JetA family protein n=1 Tax=Hahella ganghwensis TaxID=286420 RepID=UPI0003A03049|nr:Wadjet anti-phage system protein JetA family protein [Hahella ganghwensis]